MSLIARCQSFLKKPDSHQTIDEWCDALGMSRRSFTRLFRKETGLSFMTWRQQACLVAALPRLVAGETVTSVAVDLGYDNPAAFTTMFKRVLGASPRAYFREDV
jgi:AraC-like DNA-binding protein